MDEIDRHYKEAAMSLLGRFQLLEFALKIYIGLSYKLIKIRVEGIVHFGYSENDLDDLPLGRLLQNFKKLNSNTELAERMNKLRVERDHLAHRSLLITMGSLYDRGMIEDKFIEYSVLEDELTECISALNIESRRLKGHLQSSGLNSL